MIVMTDQMKLVVVIEHVSRISSNVKRLVSEVGVFYNLYLSTFFFVCVCVEDDLQVMKFDFERTENIFEC